MSAAAGHTVGTIPSTATVRVEVDGEVVAETTNAVELTETNIRNRWYVPRADVRADALTPSDTSTHCPFKGDASYHGIRTAAGERPDLAWYYPEPIPEAEAIRDHLSFYVEKDGVEVFVDGEPAGG